MVEDDEEGTRRQEVIPLDKIQEQTRSSVAASIAQRAMTRIIDSNLHSPPSIKLGH